MPDILNFKTASFLISAPTLAQCPPEHGAEVAFAGRSNAGKSSAINRLTENGKLARTSKTPGRTQLINFFALGNELQRLVDLPGYGYAKVPMAVKEEWQRHLSEYLQHRQSLKGLVLLMDIRHPLQEFDRFMLRWSAEARMPVQILLTKCDKLKRGAAKNALFDVQKQLPALVGASPVHCQLFSAVTGEGVDELQSRLNEWLALDEPTEPDQDLPSSAE